MNKRVISVLGALILAVSLTACVDDTECGGSGRLGDVTTMSMAERPSGGTSGGSRSGSSGGSGSKTGGKVKGSSSGGSSGGSVHIDDDVFEEC